MSEESRPRKPVRNAAELGERLEAIENGLEKLMKKGASVGEPLDNDEMLMRMVQLEARVAATQRSSKTTMWLLLIPMILVFLSVVVAAPFMIFHFLQLQQSNKGLTKMLDNQAGILNNQAGQLKGIQASLNRKPTARANIDTSQIQELMKALGPAIGQIKGMSDLQNSLLDELEGKKPRGTKRK